MARFDDLVDDFLRVEFEESPVGASARGLTEYDDRLDDLSAESFRRRESIAETWHDRFAGVPDQELSGDEIIDRDLVISVLTGRLILAPWKGWRRDPVAYSGPIAEGVFGLFLHRLRPDHELVEAAVSRLGQAARALEQGCANLDASLAHPIIVRRGRDAARATARYVRELLANEVQPGAERDRLAAAGAEAGRALDGWVAFLEDFETRAEGSWQLGEESYSRLLREREALPYDARGLRDRGRAELDRVDAEMRSLASTAFGTDDWNSVLLRANEDHPATEEEMRQAYAEWTVQARVFLVEKGLVSFPDGESCDVVPSPPFQRPLIGVASYMSPPSFSDSRLGHFFVPFAPDGASSEEIQRRLAGNSFGDIPTTSAHETYPGHHWHLVTRKVYSRKVRKVFATPYFNEGWALYAERVMREHGFFREPIQELYHLNATLFRAARIVVDTSLHLGEMSVEDAVHFMLEKTAKPEPVVRAEVGRYAWWPTQASAYLTGCLEILRIRDRFLADRGWAGTPADAPVELIREFHDRLAASGSLPLGLAERAVMDRAA